MKQITCKYAVDLISKQEEGKISLLQRVQLWRHLAYCNLCRYFAKQSKVIAKAFAGLDDKEAPHLTEEEKQHIFETIVYDEDQ